MSVSQQEACGPGAPAAPEDLVARLEAVFAEVEAFEPEVRRKVHELVSTLLEMYGEGLARIVESLGDEGAAGDASRSAVFDDEVVASLLLIHNLYPVPLRDRVEAALSQARPYVESHGGELSLLGIEGGVARIRLGGTCESCPSSQATLDGLLRRALDSEAPDLAGVELVDDGGGASGLLQIQQTQTRWVALEGLDGLDAGQVVGVSRDGRALLVARLEDDLLAYENACAACEGPLDEGDLRGEILICGGCQARFDLRRAGRPLAEGARALRPVPLLQDERRGPGLVLSP